MRFKKSFKISVAVFILLVLGFLFRGSITNLFQKTNPKLSGYQAVFLTNGQVYFGKISEKNSDYVVLKDIYYLQAGKQLQAGADTSSPDSQLSLVKLGNELHGPDDVMHISRAQVLFYEDLKTDGRVAQAIAEYQKK